MMRERPDVLTERKGDAMPSGREKMALLQRGADRICVLILSTDLPEVDILIEREKLRTLCEEFFPERVGLFDMIYGSRFDRLLAQFGDERPDGTADR